MKAKSSTIFVPSKPSISFTKKKKCAYPKRYKNQYQRRVKKHTPAYNRIVENHSPAEIIAGSINGNKHLQVINLEQNGLTNKFCSILSKALSKNNHVLKEMNVSYNPGVGNEARPLVNLIEGFTCKETTYFKEEITLKEEEEFNAKYAIVMKKENEAFIAKIEKQEAKRINHEKILDFVKEFIAKIFIENKWN